LNKTSQDDLAYFQSFVAQFKRLEDLDDVAREEICEAKELIQSIEIEEISD
jgi:hypothetical protein